MSKYGSEEERWEDLREPGLEAAAPDGFEVAADEDGGFEEVSADGS